MVWMLKLYLMRCPLFGHCAKKFGSVGVQCRFLIAKRRLQGMSSPDVGAVVSRSFLR